MIGRQDLRKLARVAILELCPRYTSQRALEKLLGLSPGYLCRLAAEHGNAAPSAYLVVLLAMLARDPTRIGEVQDYWARQKTDGAHRAAL